MDLINLMQDRFNGAVIGDCYRYVLWRTWNICSPRYCLFFMLNPSTADHAINDPTITRCMNYAKLWGYDGLLVVNLFGLRATDPNEIRRHPDPVGILNDDYIEASVGIADRVVCAWGTKGDTRYWNDEEAGRGSWWALTLMNMHSDVVCLKRTKQGFPVHPLYQPKDAKPICFPELQESSQCQNAK